VKTTRSAANYLVFCLAALLLAACTGQKEPAKKAIDNINHAVAMALPDADQYSPEQVASVERKLADLNAFFDKKDYAAVLAAAPAVLAEAKSLAPTVASKKDEVMKVLAAAWTELSTSVPPALSSVKTRLDALSKSHRVPKGIDLGAAKSALSDATVLWEKAQAAFQSSHVAEAVAAAKDARAQAEAAAAALKMN
jgi:hypothetical protein